MRHGFIAFLILLVSFSNVAGQEFHTYSIEADIIGDTVNERVEITFSEISNLTYVVDGYFDSVRPTSEDGEIVYSLVKGSQSYIVVSNLSDKSHLKLLFESNSPIFRKEGDVEALFKLRFPLDVDEFSLTVILPDHALPVSTEDGYSIFPTPNRQFIEKDRYHILWKTNDLKSGDEITYSAVYVEPKRSYFPYLISLVILLGALYSIYYSKKKKKDLILKGLSKDERKVIELLFEQKEAYQSEIREKIGVSKVKMTRVVQKLEEKGLLKIEKLGKKNKIFLKI